MNTKRQAGRINQKRRTRAALVDAAVELVATDSVPTIQEVADHAGISRATAYRYFSSQESLLVEAMLERAMPEIDGIVQQWNETIDAATRLDQLVQAVLNVVIDNDASFRAMLRASLDPQMAGESVRRGGRLVWLKQALEPVRDQLGPTTFERLVNALTPYLGIECLIALGDIAGLEPQQAVETARWASGNLLRAALADAER